MTDWFKVESDEQLEEAMRLSSCCHARITGTPNGNRYIDGLCCNCMKRVVRYDVYKARFRYLGQMPETLSNAPNATG